MGNNPLQITIRDIPQSDTVESKIQSKAEKLLERYREVITSIKVVADYEKKHQNHGKLYQTNIEIHIPGKTLIGHKVDENLYVAIREAFRSVSRQLSDETQIRHGEVKTHAELQFGKVARIFDDRDFGFIEDHEGNEFYFHADNVVQTGFSRLDIGSEVHFIVHIGKSGAQAHRVSEGKH